MVITIGFYKIFMSPQFERAALAGVAWVRPGCAVQIDRIQPQSIGSVSARTNKSPCGTAAGVHHLTKSSHSPTINSRALTRPKSDGPKNYSDEKGAEIDDDDGCLYARGIVALAPALLVVLKSEAILRGRLAVSQKL